VQTLEPGVVGFAQPVHMILYALKDGIFVSRNLRTIGLRESICHTGTGETNQRQRYQSYRHLSFLMSLVISRFACGCPCDTQASTA
jgi:hypothetical protein